MARTRPAHDRPNILLIHSDQHRFDCAGVNNPRRIRTPGMDRIAREGVNFTHAFAPSPICTPERACLLTGLWPTQHRSVNIPNTESYHPADAKLPTFSAALKEAGYRLGYVAKYHNEMPGWPPDFGFHEYVPEGAYDAWRTDQGLPPTPRANGWFGQIDEHITPQQSRLAWGADRIIDMMRRLAAGGEPFMLRWDPSEPHLPCTPPEPYASMYPPESVEPWPSFPDSLAGKPWVQANQLRRWNIDGWTWKQWAPVVGRYLGVIALLDAQIIRLLDALDELRLASRTLVVYTTDHGDLCGGHGMMDKHFQMYDDVMRVPLMMRWPGALPAGKTCDAFVSHAIDLAGTFCRAAGAPTPQTFMGASLLDMAARGRETGASGDADQFTSARRDIFGMYQGCQMGLYSQRMVRDRDWKYVYNATERDELYCLRTDPSELVNRAEDPACSNELRRLRDRAIAWMRHIKDPLLNQWTIRDLQA